MARWAKPRAVVSPGQTLLPFGRPERPRIETMPVAPGVTDTSRAAAAVAQHGAAERRRLVLALITGKGSHGATCDEVSAATGLPPNAVSGRFTELARLGLIVDTHARRPTRTGCAARIWVATKE